MNLNYLVSWSFSIKIITLQKIVNIRTGVYAAMSKVSKNVYRLSFFRDEGFERKQCKVCKEYFWTKNKYFETCMDAPCTDYTFLDIDVKVRNLSVREARKRFIEFFKRHGHEHVRPRPVVARWREDLYLTIASIVVFQPFVTDGIVPPPANPLVISQPCIRLEDIDNVGLTFGRHLTSFEMAAHHAFNYPDKHVYWKEETVSLAYEFFTREIGVPEDQIVFKESWWEGGGNAGPSFEVAVGGLELATLVFMQYKVVNGEYKEIPIKIVDTGYGVERIAWLTQKAPTAFHAIYGELVDVFHKKLGVPKLSNDELLIALRHAARIDPENPETIHQFVAKVSKELGISEKEFNDLFMRSARLYSILDHTRTIAWMLADGIVPSNTGEGYLARLVIRRAIRSLSILGTDTPLVDLVKYQISYWAEDFPQLLKRKEYILDVISYEEERYKETLKKGLAIINKLIKKRKKIGLNDLIELYDSHGLPPDIVKVHAEKYGIKVEVPHNFYSLVAARHKTARKEQEKYKIPKEIMEWAKIYPSTRRIFHENSYVRDFKAKIIGVKNNYVILDSTAFYPEGGGQLADKGVIYIELNGNVEAFKVLDVQKIGEVIVHVLDKNLDQSVIGKTVRGVIDWDRRYKLMRHHTATHILLGALRRVLGEHVWQAGAEKTEDKARLDITHYKVPSRDEIIKIEELANKVILDRRKVNTSYIDRNVAEEKYGFIIYQGGVPPDPKLRIVEVEGWDVEACFGTHVVNTSEVGGIKIINVDKIQDGVIRFEYVAGTQIVGYANVLEEKISSIASKINASLGNIVERFNGFYEDYNKLKEELSSIKRKLIEYIAKDIESRSYDLRYYKLYIMEAGDLSTQIIQDMLRSLIKKFNDTVIIALKKLDNDKTYIEISIGKLALKYTNTKKLIEKMSEKLRIRGGGKPDHVTGVIEENIDKVSSIIRELLAKNNQRQ